MAIGSVAVKGGTKIAAKAAAEASAKRAAKIGAKRAAVIAAKRAAKSAAKTAGRVGKKTALAAKSAARAAAKNPKLAILGLTATVVGTYAAANGLSAGEAIRELSKRSKEELDTLTNDLNDCDPETEDCSGFGIGGGDDILCSITGICIGDTLRTYGPYLLVGIIAFIILIILLKVM
jgi:hypothetical protein